jgi:hypothetical protein
MASNKLGPLVDHNAERARMKNDKIGLRVLFYPASLSELKIN